MFPEIPDIQKNANTTSPYCMLPERILRYTTLTRNTKLLVEIGQMKALAMALKCIGLVKPLTRLKHRLQIAKT
jgi:hypothetical protein